MADNAAKSKVPRVPSLNDDLPDRFTTEHEGPWGHANGLGNKGIRPGPVQVTPTPTGTAGSKGSKGSPSKSGTPS